MSTIQTESSAVTETPTQQQNNEQIQENGFDSVMPSIAKLMVWLISITIAGLVCFPFLALTIDPKHSIHFWILTAIDFGLLLALLNFKRFVKDGNKLEQQSDDIKAGQDAIEGTDKDSSSKKIKGVNKSSKKRD